MYIRTSLVSLHTVVVRVKIFTYFHNFLKTVFAPLVCVQQQLKRTSKYPTDNLLLWFVGGDCYVLNLMKNKSRYSQRGAIKSRGFPVNK